MSQSTLNIILLCESVSSLAFSHTLSGQFCWEEIGSTHYPPPISMLTMWEFNASVLESGRHYFKFNVYYFHFLNLQNSTQYSSGNYMRIYLYIALSTVTGTEYVLKYKGQQQDLGAYFQNPLFANHPLLLRGNVRT